MLLKRDSSQVVQNENTWDGLLVRMPAFKILDTIQMIFNRSVTARRGSHLEILLLAFERYHLD